MFINIILMGKNKPKKTEELSVAIAEASSTGEGDKTHGRSYRFRLLENLF